MKATSHALVPGLIDPIILNYRLDHPENPLFLANPSELLLDQGHLHADRNTYTLPRIASYFKQAALSSLVSDPYRRISDQGLLSQKELDYLKQIKQATIFIHGFNVAYGHFSEKIEAKTTDLNPLIYNGVPLSSVKNLNGYSLKTIQLSFSKDEPATVYRDIRLLINTFPQAVLLWKSSLVLEKCPWNDQPFLQTHWGKKISYVLQGAENYFHWFDTFSLKNIVEPIFSDNSLHYISSQYDELDLINGKGAHNWWLNVEYQLNCGRGFTGFSDQQNPDLEVSYQRLIALAWQADPVSLLDYNAVELMAMATAPLFMQLIEQLAAENIPIKIIAHSVGAALVFYTLELLGKKYSTPLVNECVLWQAAVPNTVFNSDQDLSLMQRWRLPHVLNVVEHFYVFYSQHDNVLGPFPSWQGKVESKLIEKYHTPGGGKAYAIEAYVIDMLDHLYGAKLGYHPLGSVYLLAQQCGYAFDTLLFDRSLRYQAYHCWYLRYHIWCDKNYFLGRQQYEPTLIKQKDRLCQHPELRVREALDRWRWLIGLLVAVVHEVVPEYLADVENYAILQKIIAHFDEISSDLATHLYERFQQLIPSSEARRWFALLNEGGAFLYEFLQAEFDVEEFSFFNQPMNGLIAVFVLMGYFLKELPTLIEVVVGNEKKIFERYLGLLRHFLEQLRRVGENLGAAEKAFDQEMIRLILNFLLKTLKPSLQKVLHTSEWRETQRQQVLLKQSRFSHEEQQAQVLPCHLVNHAKELGLEMAAFLLTVFTTPECRPTAALGYAGAEASSVAAVEGKLTQLNLTNCLYHHSAMKYPSEPVFKKIYDSV